MERWRNHVVSSSGSDNFRVEWCSIECFCPGSENCLVQSVNDTLQKELIEGVLVCRSNEYDWSGRLRAGLDKEIRWNPFKNPLCAISTDFASSLALFVARMSYLCQFAEDTNDCSWQDVLVDSYLLENVGLYLLVPPLFHPYLQKSPWAIVHFKSHEFWDTGTDWCAESHCSAARATRTSGKVSQTSAIETYISSSAIPALGYSNAMRSIWIAKWYS